ncbi:MAG TPA: DUF364 domain-containing protein [Bacillota bacterium]|nr:DUF364 domain-containing protein [Bacillota bacterium]
MKNPWKLYDALIEGVDPSWRVDHYSLGVTWCEVWSGEHTGIAMCIRERGPGNMFPAPEEGMSLRAMASMIKSWNYLEASLGAAALNCYYNTVDRARDLGGFRGLEITTGAVDQEKRQVLNAFFAFQDEITGKKVAVIGHFPHIEKRFGERADMIVIERNPMKGDYPDPASDYILRDQDYAFITGTTLINKTLPKLLEVAGDHCKVSLVGPSTCMAPLLFDLGVHNLSGYCVTDQKLVDRSIRRGEVFSIFDAGYMVSIDRPE